MQDLGPDREGTISVVLELLCSPQRSAHAVVFQKRTGFVSFLPPAASEPCGPRSSVCPFNLRGWWEERLRVRCRD